MKKKTYVIIITIICSRVKILLFFLNRASSKPESTKGYDDYMTAQYYGQYYGDCSTIYPECPMSVLSFISNLHL